MNDISQLHAGDLVDAQAVAFDTRPPGERYYRHPGDIVRVVIWAAATVLLILLIEVAEGTNTGIREDIGEAAALVPRAARELALGLAQLTAVVIPIVVLALLAWQRRWRRISLLVLAAVAGGGAYLLLDAAMGLEGAVPDAVDETSWLLSTRFPPVAYVAGAAAAAVVGKPWLSREWRRSADRGLLLLLAVLVIAGTSGLAEVLLAVTAGSLVGAALLVAFGAPNRRPSPQAVADALAAAGLPAVGLTLERAVGGRSQLYRGAMADGSSTFIKVYSADSRDADVLFRGYRRLILREPGDEWPAASLDRDVEHEGLLLLLACRGGARCPELRGFTSLPDGSAVLAMEDLRGRPLDSLSAEELDDSTLDSVWQQVHAFHATGLAHRALRTANIVVTDDTPAIVDLSAATAPADARMQAIDRAELLTSLATVYGAEASVAAAARTLDANALAAASPYIQPLALSAATRKRASKSTLKDVRESIAAVTGREPEKLEPLVRVRPRTIFMIATLTGAFYFLLPQLANVDDSVSALRSANWGWIAACVVTSIVTYVAAGVGMIGGVSQKLSLVPTTQVQLASSFVNRVTPANVGGMALNVRYLQKAGVPPAEAVTGMGLNVVAGGIVHIGAAAPLLRLGGPWRRRGVLTPEQQQSAGRDRRVDGSARHCHGVAMGSQDRHQEGVAGRAAGARQRWHPRPLTPAPAPPLRRFHRGHTRLRRSPRLRCERVRRRRQLRPGWCGLPRIVDHRRCCADAGWLGRDGGGARRRFHGDRHGRRPRRGDGAQLPPCHLLVADLARLDQPQVAREAQLHLSPGGTPPSQTGGVLPIRRERLVATLAP